MLTAPIKPQTFKDTRDPICCLETLLEICWFLIDEQSEYRCRVSYNRG
jgi:hypothetical protein